MKKVFFSIIIVVLGGGFMFLMYFDDGKGEKLSIPELEEKKTKPVTVDKSKVIAEDIEKDQRKDVDERVKQMRDKESKLDFGDLFRKHDAKLAQGQKETKETPPLNVPVNPVKEPVVQQSKTTTVNNNPSTPVVRRKIQKTAQIVKENKTLATPEEASVDTANTSDVGMSFSSHKKEEPVQEKSSVKVSQQAGGTIVSQPVENVAKIAVYGDFKVKQNTKIEFRLLEPFTVAGHKFNANTIFEGMVLGVGQRIMFKVSQIDKFFHSFQILGDDYEPGMYNGSYNSGQVDITRETSGNIESNVLTNSGINNMGVARELINGTRKSLQKKADYSVAIENGRPLYLKY